MVVFLLWFGAESAREGERRAAVISAFFLVATGLLFASAFYWPATIHVVAAWCFVGLGAAFALLFFLPVGRDRLPSGRPTWQVDERDIMFARSRLNPGSEEYDAYYAMRPEHLAGDEKTRAKPGLLSLRAKLANPFHFASAEASFSLTDALRDAVDGPTSAEAPPLSPKQLTPYLRHLAVYYGALDVGITRLKPYHVYSHIGRGSGTYGAPIALNHTYAIAFITEMDREMMADSPNSPVVMESARQYVETARIAVQLATAIRHLGFAARAHIDGNYRVIAPLVAKDAGLGEIGRMGLLMTRRLGPRVRIGVVTTDAVLVPDSPSDDPATIDFCTICKKCADNCPSHSIPQNDRREESECRRWRIDSDTCFRYWSVIGTDCGRCMAVCPFSHPDAPLHNLTRWGIARSGFVRRLALWMDDLFYGRKPKPRRPPPWTKVP